MYRTLFLGLICLLLLGSMAGGAAPERADVAGVPPDSVVLQFTVDERGDATWLVSYRVRLDTENRTEAFAAVRSEIDRDPAAYRARFADRIRRTIGEAENETGRPMGLRNVTVDARREAFQNVGVVSYRFTWTNFAVRDGRKLLVGDAISGLYVDRDTTLVVRVPPSYVLDSATPDPDATRESELVWLGPVDFDADEPRLVIAPTDESAPVTAGADASSGDPGVPLAPLLAGVLFVGAAATAAAGARRRGLWETASSPEDPLLSDEERVVALLEAEGGRVKQQRIAREFDWTDTKTSRVVSNLRERGRVRTVRVGRENVVALSTDGGL